MNAPHPSSLQRQGIFHLPHVFPLVSIAFVCLAFAANVFYGSTTIPFEKIFLSLLHPPILQITPVAQGNISSIVWELRMPRAVLMLMVGISLGLSGCAYQGIFRNPLADPYILGIGSGAGLGAVLAMTLSLPVLFSYLSWIPIFAFIGSILTVLLVYRMSNPGGGGSATMRLILSGVAIGAFANALSTMLMLRTQNELQRAMAWILGGAFLGGWQPIVFLLPYFIIGMISILAFGRVLNALQFGDDQAKIAGVHVSLARLSLILITSILTAAAVSFSGIIGFIGLAIPHIARIIRGPDYRTLLPASGLLGGGFLLLADLVARSIFSPQELPVGVITALLGGPFFLYLLQHPPALSPQSMDPT